MESGGTLFYLGPFGISLTVVTTWGIMLALGLFSALATRRLRDEPRMLQSALESLKQSVNRLEQEMMRRLWRLSWREA